jgi:hypothetical protein
MTPERLVQIRVSVAADGVLAGLAVRADRAALLAEVDRLRALALALLDEWLADELRINSEWYGPEEDARTQAACERRRREILGESPPTPGDSK